MTNLYDYDDRQASELIEVPKWVEQDISLYNLAAILESGCASGAYMPAVTYFEARETMNQYGDDVLQLLQDNLGELPKPSADESWSGLACFYLSYAVELWAAGVEEEISDALDAEGEGPEELGDTTPGGPVRCPDTGKWIPR